MTQASTCDSCGDTEDGLTAVRRVYVTPEAWDTEGSATVVPDVEHWCYACRSHYPHQDAADT